MENRKNLPWSKISNQNVENLKIFRNDVIFSYDGELEEKFS
mgnify:CR=1 FL=1